jgi:hypothetical protein
VRTDETIWTCDTCGRKSRHKYHRVPKGWFWAHSKKIGIAHICDKCTVVIDEKCEIKVKFNKLGK